MTTKLKVGNHAELIQQKREEVQAKMGQKNDLNQYMLETLDSFAFRYFIEPLSAELISENELRVIAIEKGIKEAIKIKNPILRNGISELVKRVSKAEGPTILSELKLKMDMKTNHSGTVQLSGRISFDHPEHEFKKDTFIEKLSLFHYVDEIDLRNNLAKHLEIVCEIFI